MAKLHLVYFMKEQLPFLKPAYTFIGVDMNAWFSMRCVRIACTSNLPNKPLLIRDFLIRFFNSWFCF